MSTKRHSAFTIIELLVVVSIIALLVGILLPAIGRARDQAKATMSAANLRNLGTAHGSYAAEWADRQFTLVNDGIGEYGDNTAEAFLAYFEQHGGDGMSATHPGPIFGWAHLNADPSEPMVLYGFHTHEDDAEGFGGYSVANASMNLPINFGAIITHFGSFRLGNCRQFGQYVSDKFYDPVFYAPKDRIVVDTIEGGGFDGRNCFNDPGEYCPRPIIPSVGDIPVWTSYVLSPAGMLSPQVLARDDPDDPSSNGFQDPWSLKAGFRSPSFSQCLYPSLKTQVLEHHWLQNTQVDCSPAFSDGTYSGCEPYYFNHAWESSPITLFYDGHVESIGVRNAMRADGRMQAQTGWGLWSRDTPFGEDGYLIDLGYDQAATSFHVLTTDGIRGRDILAD
ncbi:MAG: type II secretion system protein [Phycisphaerales bacterium]|nr:type II secretion system GspH family protein [Phycisphaerae bacterium]NNF43877.1 type II secretion system protein [Phycisphaerales bacterium]NNM25449.1 type II secretion system protein [Phycisphaerales bacterium]